MSTCPICPGCEGAYPGPPRLGAAIYMEAEAMRADQRYYTNADRSKVVPGDSPEACFLLAAEGDDISNDDAKRYGLGRYAPEPETEVAPEPAPDPGAGKAVTGPPDNKAVPPPAKPDPKAKPGAGTGSK